MGNFGLRDFDWLIVVCILLLGAFGMAIIGSVAPTLVASQLGFYLVGLALFFLFAKIDYRIFVSVWRHVYGVALILLVITLILGLESRGAVRWISIGGFRLQLSELLKPFLIASMATFLSNSDNGLKKFLLAAVIGLVPAMLIFKQPDLGSALVYCASFIMMMFASGLSSYYFLASAAFFAILLPIFWHFLANYQKQRILSFLNPQYDPLGASYNAIQALIAVGSGMFLGWGLGRGPQSQLMFLPEHHTDFIFASLAEELGFIGAGALLGIYFVLIWRIFYWAGKSSDPVARILAVGLGTMLLGQVFINVGMNVGVVPVTGVTLPLVSYGGSSILATMIALGMVENIAQRGQKDELLLV
jgi:rod shape determining protein RodA